MPTGALIDPMGSGEALSEEEHIILKVCLNLCRSDEWWHRGIQHALYCLERTDSGRTLGAFLDSILSRAGRHSDEFVGMLAIANLRQVELLQDKEEGANFDEPTVLAEFLKVLRRGGWFAAWLEARVINYADGSNPLPTPLEVMGLLTDDAAEFAEKLSAAREVLQEYWGALGFPGITPPDPAKYGAPANTPEPAPAPASWEKAEEESDSTPPKPAWYLSADDGTGNVTDVTYLKPSEYEQVKKYIKTMRSHKPRRAKKAAA
jgi:hypothetical protein